jgi:phosphate starvation-inducible PhoH-like protein
VTLAIRNAAGRSSDATGVQTQLDFPDNRIMIDLCGVHDRNLARIEQVLDLSISRKGNSLTLHGEAGNVRRAADVLNTLYRRIGNGRAAGPGELDALLRTDRDEAGQIEMFRPGEGEIRTRRKLVEPRTRAQKDYVKALQDHELVFGLGPAGTGKTYLAVAVGVSLFIEGRVDRIILSRPAVEAGERLGFLPGDMKEKVDPYMQPLYDALNDFLPVKTTQRLIEEKQIEIAPLAFMRGRTLSNAFIVLDEAQNATTMQMKMFLTRLGEGSRMAITGDMSQIDLPKGTVSGLVEAERILKSVKGIGFARFTASDIVRHPMVARIVEAYEADHSRHG